MIHTVDQRLRREAREFELQFSCEACVHYAEPTESCGNGYPVLPHRRVDLERAASITFCKEFELA
jgi:hypothetical protein